MTGFRWKFSVLVAFFVADLIGIVFLGYSAAQVLAAPASAGWTAKDVIEIITLIGGIVTPIALGWLAWQNKKLQTQQQTLTGQMDGMKDALVKSERAVAKTAGREEIIAEQKAEEGVRAVIRAEVVAASPSVDHAALARAEAAKAAPPAAAVAAPPAAAVSAPPAADVAAPPAVREALAEERAREAQGAKAANDATKKAP